MVFSCRNACLFASKSQDRQKLMAVLGNATVFPRTSRTRPVALSAGRVGGRGHGRHVGRPVALLPGPAAGAPAAPAGGGRAQADSEGPAGEVSAGVGKCWKKTQQKLGGDHWIFMIFWEKTACHDEFKLQLHMQQHHPSRI